MPNPFIQLTVADSDNQLVAKAVELFVSRWKDRTRIGLRRSKATGPRPAWEIVIGTTQQPELSAVVKKAGLPLPVKQQAYSIAVTGKVVTVCGADGHGVLYGLGHLLRNLAFAPNRVSLPALKETRTPAVYNRGVFFANHFNNWYETAAIEQVEHYIEEMALWGFDILSYCFDTNWFPHGFWNDPQSRGMRTLEKIRRMGEVAHACGMKILMSGGANEGFENQPPLRLRADSRARHGGFYLYSQICPSKPGGLKMILDVRRKVTELMGHIDIYTLWPYDQGGCGCDQCAHAPGRWGKKYLEIGPAIAAAVRESQPNAQIVVATWLMDKPERQMVYELCDQKADWFQGIMTQVEHAGERKVDSRYFRMVFPEISMFDCYFSSYGCNGANPAPKRFAAEARHTAKQGCGTMIYSEGFYEDINKAVYAGLLWNPDRDVGEVLDEYARYYFGEKNVKTAVALIRNLETTWGAKALLAADSKKVAALEKTAESLKKRLPRHLDAQLRWRQLRDRAKIDRLMKAGESWLSLVRQTRILFDQSEYISAAELRRRVNALLVDLRLRKRQVDELFAAHWEYMKHFHFAKTNLVFLPDEVMGKYNWEPLIDPLAAAVSIRDEAQMRDAVSSAFKRWYWFNGIDSGYLFG